MPRRPIPLVGVLFALTILSLSSTTPHVDAFPDPLDSGGTGIIASAPFACTDVTEIPQHECEALVALYLGTDGPHWTQDDSWLRTTTPCDWYGVACAEGQVSSLDLQHNELIGMLPAEIADLEALESVDLSFNALSGPIPPELGELTKLQSLDLNDTLLAGPLPPEIGQLASLQTLALSRARITGTLPSELGVLDELQYLSLDGNLLEGALPPELGGLTKLGVLLLNDNGLSGAIPPEWGELKSLRTLDLGRNQLTGAIPPELGNLDSVRSLYLNDNHLEGPIPPELANLKALRRYTPSSAAEPLGMDASPPVDGYLDLSSNRLSGSIPPELGELRALYELRLTGNQLSGAIPVDLATFSRPDSILVDYNALYESEAGSILPSSGWKDTQTVPPDRVTVSSLGTSIAVTWEPIRYTGDGGYYEVRYAPEGGEEFEVAGHTADKTDATFTVTGLTPGVRYAFRIRTYTPAHPFIPSWEESVESYQQNELWSDYSAPVYATAYDPETDVDCGPPPTPSTPYSGVPPASNSIYKTVSHCLDDAYVTLGSTTHMDNSGLYVRMGGREGSQVPYVSYVDGLLFRDLRIPQGAHILSATLRQYTWWQSGIPVKVAIAGELTPDAADFRLSNPWPIERAQTSVTVTWHLYTQNLVVTYSPDVSAIVQEIVDQESWRPGNDLALLISPLPDDKEYVDWQAFDFRQSSAAQLMVSYGDPETPTPTPSPTPTPTATPAATPASRRWFARIER